MGYALDLRVIRPLGDLVDELTTPTLDLDDVDPAVRDRLPEPVVANWALLADTIANAIGDGGGTPAGSLVHYVVAMISLASHSWLTIDYSSASGDWFRDALMGTHVAGLLGSDAVAHLLRRPIADLAPPDLPAWGHLTSDEVAALTTRDLAVAEDHPAHATLRDLARVVERAARMDCAIVTIHA